MFSTLNEFLNLNLCLLCILWYSIRGRYRKEWKKSREKELIILTGLRETVTGGKRRPQGESSPSERYTQVGGAEREKGGGSEGQGLSWGSGGRTHTGWKTGPHWTGCVLRGHRRGGQGGDRWRWPAFTLAPRSLWWGVYTLSVGTCRQQENLEFENVQYRKLQNLFTILKLYILTFLQFLN